MLFPLRRSMNALGLRAIVRHLSRESGLAASVVIVTRDRASYLELTLAALERQRFPPDAWETIVVDDASLDDTRAVTESCQRRGRLQMVVHPLAQPQGAVCARNQTLQMARGKIVIFLSESGLAEPDFLLHHLRHHLREPCVVIGDRRCVALTHLFAPLDPPPLGAPNVPLLAVEELLSDLQSGAVPSLVVDPGSPSPDAPNDAPVWTRFSAQNSSVPRALLEQVGGFDEAFRPWSLADEELGWRLFEAQTPFRIEERAGVVRQNAPAAPLAGADISCNLHRFFCKHPALPRETLEPRLLQNAFA